MVSCILDYYLPPGKLPAPNTKCSVRRWASVSTKVCTKHACTDGRQSTLAVPTHTAPGNHLSPGLHTPHTTRWLASVITAAAVML